MHGNRRTESAALTELVGTIYEAALEHDRWHAVLAQVAALFRCGGSVVFAEDFRARRAPFGICHGYAEADLKAYTEHYFYLDPGADVLLQREEGAVMATNLAVPRAEWLASEYYNDFAHGIGIRHQMGSLFVRSEEGAGGFAVQRRAGQRPFGPEDTARFSRLVPHLRRAFVLIRHLEESERVAERLMSLVEQTRGAVALLDGHGRVVACSPAAERIVAAGDGLGLVAGRLQAADATSSVRLEALIADAVRTGRGQGQGAGGALSVARPSGRPAYDLLVLPLVTGALSDEHRTRDICGAVLIRERSSEVSIDEAALRALFELTGAEARTAAGLAAGRAPEDIAAEHDISPYTVRAQLSAIYEKLGVHRQAELVQRVLSSPAALAGRGDDAPGDDD